MTPDPAAASLTDGYLPPDPVRQAAYREAGLMSGAPLWAPAAASAERTPDAPAVTDAATGTTLTYGELWRASARRAAGFAALGIEPGDRVVVQLGNSAAFVVTVLALLRAGAAPVLTLPAHRINEIAHLAAGSGAVAYVTEDDRRGYDYRDLAAELRRRVPGVAQVLIDGDPGAFAPLPDDDPARCRDHRADPDHPALFQVSGGTTGLPKLIARSHNDYAYTARRSAEIAGLTAADVYLAALPVAHNFPMVSPGLLGALDVGAHTVMTGNPSPDSAFALIERYRVTVTSLVPALAQLWCAATEWEPADLSSLRLLQVGGARLAESDAIALDAALGDVVQQVFGMAEGFICYTRLDDPRELVHVSQGAPMSSFDEVRIVDDDGHDVADGEDGELLVRGPTALRGYYRAPEHNARSFTPDGFYRSGDRVRRLPSGHLAVTGRIKDTIIRAGENVAADDIEEHLLAHPSVWQTAVVGVPDDALGERICAVVVPSGPSSRLDLPTVRAFLADRGLAAFKLPDRLEFATGLPVTAVGKVDKAAVRARLGA